MIININDSKKISQIKEEFNLLFPYLKIEFYGKLRVLDEKETIQKMQLVNDDRTLGQCRSIHNSGMLDILPSMSVHTLEEHFRNDYGLHVQVFRKSGKAWLETTVTSKWTLEEQNKQGELVTSHMTRQENNTDNSK